MWGGTSDAAAGVVAAYTGVDTKTPATPVNTFGGAPSLTAPSITTNRGNVRLLGFFGVQDLAAVTAAPTMSTVGGAMSSGSPGPTKDQVSVKVAEQEWPTAGSTGSRTGTTASTISGAETAGQLVALQPPLVPFASVSWTPSASAFASGQRFQLAVNGTAQTPETLSAATSSKSAGPLVTGTPYTASITATIQSWTSSTPQVSFTGHSC